MSNPLYNTNDSPNGATQPTKAVNRQSVHVPRTHNTFDMSYHVYKTQHYGLLEPFFVMEGVAGDKIPLSSSHDVRTFPMSSPFLSKLTLNKDYFMVPMQAILPNTWEYIFKNPSQGDDVPEDAYCKFRYDGLCISLSLKLSQTISALGLSDTEQLRTQFLYYVVALDTLLSSGSLMSSLGYNPSWVAKRTLDSLVDIYSVDDAIDMLYSLIDIKTFKLTIDGNVFNYTTNKSQQTSDTFYVTKHTAISLIRRFSAYISELTTSLISGYKPFSLSWLQEGLIDEIDLSRVFSYQLACFQYYVNPQVDYLYNAQLWRDNLITLLRSLYGGTFSLDSFTQNGISIPYDFLSRHYVTKLGDFLDDNHINGTVLQIINYIFGYNDCLKFGDYFTDCRTRPYAPGDMNAPVVGNNVSAIDITKSISMQRFLNSVVRLGNNFGDYLRGIFGTTPSPDYHFPKFIAHQEFDISGFEVANTSDTSQGSLVTNLKSTDDKFAFEVDVDMPCILIGISYFRMPQVYSQTIDRHFFHVDRFDMFNPMLQFIGDQPVFAKELSTFFPRPADETFGYQSRFAEYKQRYSLAVGGFADKLPAWAYISDKVVGLERNILPFNVQSPYFIRALSNDFDRFLTGLSGNSLGHDFHFIVVYNNKCVCNRPMEVNPNIL